MLETLSRHAKVLTQAWRAFQSPHGHSLPFVTMMESVCVQQSSVEVPQQTANDAHSATEVGCGRGDSTVQISHCVVVRPVYSLEAEPVLAPALLSAWLLQQRLQLCLGVLHVSCEALAWDEHASCGAWVFHRHLVA